MFPRGAWSGGAWNRESASRMPVRLLCLGDIHLGRVPGKIPGGSDAARSYSPVAAFGNAVEWALDNAVDAVLLAGDVVDNNRDRFEGLPVLAEGAKKLSDAGIKIIAVAGNHDVEALPRLLKRVPAIKHLGADGKWESVEIDGGDGTTVDILGWSFPRGGNGYCRENPLDSLDASDFPQNAIGLLHANLDASGSPYAPVRRAELEAVPVSAWLLGHIHKPDALSSMKRPIGYLGSICGLDPGEPGARGAWLATVHSGGAVEMERVPIAPIRWEQIEIDALDLGLSDSSGIDDAKDAVAASASAAAKELAKRISEELGSEKAVGCRIRVSGRSPASANIRAVVLEDPEWIPPETVDGVDYFVEKTLCSVRPELDVEVLSKGVDAVALLARRILALEKGGDAAAGMIRGFRGRISSLHPGMRPAGDDDDTLRERMLEGGYEALDALVADAESGGGVG